MNVYFSLALCFLPFILCFICFPLFFKVKISKQFIAALLALATIIPVTAVQFIFDSFRPETEFLQGGGLARFLFKIFIFNGIFEEGLKAGFLLFMPCKKVEFKHFFLLSLLFGLLFGCFESVVYFLHQLQINNEKGGQLIYSLVFARMFSANLVHLFCAGLSGLFVWSLKTKQINFLPLVYAVLSHTLFNFFIYFNSSIKWFALAGILFAVIECRVYFEKLVPEQIYKKDEKPASDNADKTIESALKKAPTYTELEEK